MGTTRPKRERNIERFPNMPKFGAMPAICLEGEAGIPGTEHNKVQTATDIKIARLGGTGDTWPGTAPLGKVIDTSIDETASFIGEKCRKELQDQANSSFQGRNRNQLVRTNPLSPRFQQETMGYLLKIPPPTYP